MIAPLLRLSVRRAGGTLALALLLTALALERLPQAGLDIFPEFAPKQVVVQTEAVGFSSTEVERQVTFPLERLLLGLPGVEEVRSESIPGLSVITLTFGEDVDLLQARQQVGERLGRAKLPPAVGPPVVVPLSSSAATVMTLGVVARGRSLLELRDWTERFLLPKLLSIPGVADVNLFGGGERTLQIRLKPDRLWEAGIGLQEVGERLTDLLRPEPLGLLHTGNQELLLQLSMEALPSWLEGVAVRPSLPLSRIAEIGWGERLPVSRAQIEGERGLILMVIGQRGESIFQISRRIEAHLQAWQEVAARSGIQLRVLFRPADYIERSFQNLAGHLAIGSLLVLLLGYLFLGDLRAALISLTAIPLSLLAAAVAMVSLGSTLNLMVLGGLAIAIGEVVDDAIIDVENLLRRARRTGESSCRLILAACLEVRGSVVYATLIVALVFTPIYAIEGVVENLFAPLASAYIAAVLASLLVALTVTPAMAALLLQGTPPDPPRLAGWLVQGLPPLIRRLAPICQILWFGMALLTVGLLWALRDVETRLIPPLNEGHLILHTAMLPGTDLEQTLQLGGRLIEALHRFPEVVSVSQWSGRAERGADTFGSFYSEYEIRLRPLAGEAQAALLRRIEELLERFPGIEYEINTFLIERINETLSGQTADLVVAVTGPDAEEAQRLLIQLTRELTAIPELTQIRHHTQALFPELLLKPDLDSVQRLQVTPADLRLALKTAYFGQPLGHAPFGGRSYPVELLLERSPALERLQALPLTTPHGLIPLGEAVSVQQREVPYRLLHLGGERWQMVSANVRGDFDTALTEVERAIGKMVWPEGYRVELRGAVWEQRRVRRSLLFYALLVGSAVLLLVHLALGSFRAALFTLLNLPLALSGGAIAVLLTQSAISIGSLVGFITLFGITVRNTLLLLGHYLRRLGEGASPTLGTAIAAAQERVVAILTTGLITAGAMLPLALEPREAGLEILGPMAQVIVGGLVSSTMLTVLLLPPLLPKLLRKGPRTGRITL